MVTTLFSVREREVLFLSLGVFERLCSLIVSLSVPSSLPFRRLSDNGLSDRPGCVYT